MKLNKVIVWSIIIIIIKFIIRVINDIGYSIKQDDVTIENLILIQMIY